MKRYERLGNEILQICKQLTVDDVKDVEESDGAAEARLTRLREEIGIWQHHDAITGTAKQHVTDDYYRRLDSAVAGCSENIAIALNNYTNSETTAPLKFEFSNCLHLNISECVYPSSVSTSSFLVTVYNPLGQSNNEYIRVPVYAENYQVTDSDGNTVESQIVPIPTTVRDLSFRQATSQYELVFRATEIPPVGYKTYYISKIDGSSVTQLRDISATTAEVIGNDDLTLSLDLNGVVSKMKYGSDEVSLTQNFYYYEGVEGNNREAANRSSGAYIFRPVADLKHNIGTTPTKVQIIEGNLFDEVHQIFNEYVSQVIRIYKDEDHVEFEWLVGPIPVDDEIGKEIVTVYKSSTISNNGVFYTDSNGREMMKRQKNFRHYTANIEEEVAGNYYPVVSKIAIEDATHRMSVLVDRAQGGTSLSNGELELMLHRRLLHDDAFGVGEALDEEQFNNGLIARGKHYLVFGSQSETPSVVSRERILQYHKQLAPYPFFSDSKSLSVDNWRNLYVNSVRLINNFVEIVKL